MRGQRVTSSSTSSSVIDPRLYDSWPELMEKVFSRVQERMTACRPPRYTPPPHHSSEKMCSGGFSAASCFRPQSVMCMQPYSLLAGVEGGGGGAMDEGRTS